ncbi:MAG TPA: hypothetical protein VMC83_00670 [Streptosporangiaceae bacterium]|nr:hypothetical protein [Streptosporangiaceae bacterium]
MTWVTWRQYRNQGALAAALFAVLAVILLLTGLHAEWAWQSCLKDNGCGTASLYNPLVASIVVATSAVPVLPGLFWGAPMAAQELETGTNQFAWTQSITRRRWLAVKAGWLLLAAAAVAGVVSAVVTWWSGPNHALTADAFQLNWFDISDIVPVGYAVFAMALGICAGLVLRRTLPALAVTLAGFVALRALIALWLRPRYLTPVTMYYKLTAPFTPTGSYLPISQGAVVPSGRPPAPGSAPVGIDGVPVPAVCQRFIGPVEGNLHQAVSCMAAHGYRGYVTYQPASRFWAFQGIETGIFVVLAAALLGVAFWMLKRRDA